MVGDDQLERVVVDGVPSHRRGEQHRGGEDDGVVDPGHELAQVELETGSVGDGEETEELAVHATHSAQVAVGTEHRQDTRHVDPHVDDPGDGVDAVELSSVERQPRSVRLHPELAVEPCPQELIVWPPDHAHETQVALRRWWKLGQIGVDDGRRVATSNPEIELAELGVEALLGSEPEDRIAQIHRSLRRYQENRGEEGDDPLGPLLGRHFEPAGVSSILYGPGLDPVGRRRSDVRRSVTLIGLVASSDQQIAGAARSGDSGSQRRGHGCVGEDVGEPILHPLELFLHRPPRSP